MGISKTINPGIEEVEKSYHNFLPPLFKYLLNGETIISKRLATETEKYS